MELRAVRGTKDVFGNDILKFNYIVNLARYMATLHNFKELMIPTFEFSDVFERNLGDTSDIVLKEVYKFKDRSNNYLSLRPEFTAGVVRALLTNADLRDKLPIKLFSYGSVFRYDRPQKGRQREFNQVNFEYYGNSDYSGDVAIIAMANRFVKALDLKNITLELNSLGSDESRSKFETALRNYFEKYKNDLSDDSKVRLEKNVLRILDSKDEGDRKLLAEAPKIANFYTRDDHIFFNSVTEKLNLLGIDFKINPMLVRGLDYYTSTVFEFTTTDLGAQATIMAGGRYDRLVAQMGGGDIPAVGCGGGIERLMLLLDRQFSLVAPVSIVPIGDEEIDYCLKLQQNLLDNHIPCEVNSYGKMKKKMDLANRNGSRYSVIVGEEEIKSDNLTIKDMQTAQEIKLSPGKLVEFLKIHSGTVDNPNS